MMISSLLLAVLTTLPTLQAMQLFQNRHQQQRILEAQQDGFDDDSTSEFEYDLSTFSLKFEKCQYVKSFDDELATSDQYSTVLATRQYVVFQILPSDQCYSSSKSVVHGEYVVELSDYLAAVVPNRLTAFQQVCDNCNEYCESGPDSCTGCGKACYDWENMPNNGYVDASQFMTCTKTDAYQEQNEGDQMPVYIGPKCSADGQSIMIGVFLDENCWEADSGSTVEEILESEISNYILDQVFSSSNENGGTSQTACISCAESDDNNVNNNNQADGDSVNEMCEQIYDKAAKCESIFGLTTGFIHVNRENDKNNGEKENQVENEFLSCNFIQSLIWNSYTETGEINYMAEQDEVIREVTEVQATVLACLSVFFVGIIGYGVYLHFAIKRLSATVDVTLQTDGVYT